jgi:hypothetical protein
MGIFVYNYLSIILFAYLSNTANNKTLKHILRLLIIFQLSFLCGFRGYNVGWDTQNYANHFFRVSRMPFHEAIWVWNEEIGYSLLQYLVASVSKSPTLLFYVIGLFYSISVTRFITKYSKSWALSYALFIALGLYTFSMTALRQTVALGFVLYAYDSLWERRFLKFLLFTLAASTFHFSALVFLPAYYLVTRDYRLREGLFTVAMVSFIYLFRNIFFQFITTYTIYTYGEYETLGPRNFLFMLVLIFVFSLFFLKISKNYDHHTRFYFYCISMTLGLTVFAFIHPATLRITYYYFFGVVVFFPNIIKASFGSKLSYFIIVVLVLALALLYFRGLDPASSPFVPYSFIWD